MKTAILKRMWPRPLWALLAGGVMTGLSAPLIMAATVDYYWTGASQTSGRWSVGANWFGGVAPNGGDERIIFPINPGRRNSTNNLPDGTLFHSIWIFGVNYEIHGNAIRTTNLTMELEFPGGTSTFGLEIRASGDLTILANTANTHLIVSGDIVLSGDDLRISRGLALPESQNYLTLSGAISGNGNLIKDSYGHLTLSGSSPNTFTGSTTFINGTVTLNKAALFPPGPLVAVPGDLVINNTVILERDDQIAPNADVTNYGLLDLNDHHQTIRSLTLASSTVTTGTGVLTLGGNVTAPDSNFDSSISGRLSLGSNTRRFDVASNVVLRIPAAISAGLGALDAGVIKSGDGTLRLSGANTYAGPTTIRGGTLTAANDSALGSTAGGTTLENGTLTLVNSVIANEPLVIQPDLNTLESAGASSWIGNIALEGTTLFSAGTGDVLRVTGVISGAGGLRKTGTGTLVLLGSTPNTFEGNAQVNAGTLELRKPSGVMAIPGRLVVGLGGSPDSDVVRLFGHHQIADDAVVNLSSSGLLDLNNFSDTVRGVTNSGHVALGSGTLTVTNESTDRAFSGTISGTGDFIKLGAAALTLAGTNTYSGDTFLRGGILTVNGSLASPLLRVQSGTLSGTGTVQSVNVFNGGTISPGDPLGILRVAQDLTFLGGALHLEINSTVPESGYDRLRVSGNVAIGSAALSVGFGFQPPFNTNFIILNQIGPDPISGTFANLPEGGFLHAGGFVFQISYLGNTGNDVTLERVFGPPTLYFPTRLADGRFQFQGLGEAGLTYAIQANTNLNTTNWLHIGDAPVNPAGLFQFTDANAPQHPKRFYRAVLP